MNLFLDYFQLNWLFLSLTVLWSVTSQPSMSVALVGCFDNNNQGIILQLFCPDLYYTTISARKKKSFLSLYASYSTSNHSSWAADCFCAEFREKSTDFRFWGFFDHSIPVSISLHCFNKVTQIHIYKQQKFFGYIFDVKEIEYQHVN